MLISDWWGVLARAAELLLFFFCGRTSECWDLLFRFFLWNATKHIQIPDWIDFSVCFFFHFLIFEIWILFFYRIDVEEGKHAVIFVWRKWKCFCLNKQQYMGYNFVRFFIISNAGDGCIHWGGVEQFSSDENFSIRIWSLLKSVY